jgi:hypothetical protein
MKSVFVVFHEYEMTGGCDSVKLIGIYSSEETGKSAVSRASKQSGFRDFPDGFCIDEYEIDKDHWQEGFVGLDPTEI